jgi:hypothetical protein
MGLLTKLLSSSIKKKLRKYVEFLSTGSDEEIGQLLAWATIVRETLIDAEEAFEILDGETPFMYTVQTEKTIAAIIQIKSTEIEFKKEIQHQPFGGPLLGGFVVWKMTIFCLIGKKGELFDTEGYVLGRKIWNEMNRGIPYVKDNLKMIYEMSGGQLPIYEWHYENCNYIPEMFNSNR